MRRLVVFPVIAVLSVLYAGMALAAPDSPPPTSVVTDPLLLGLIANDDLFSVADLSTVLDPPPFSPATQHYGPYESSSGDSGCGITEWAVDTFDRHFTVRANATGGFTIVEQFKNGGFVTDNSTSPGELCPEENEATPDGFITAGVTGTMHGYFIITDVIGPQTSMSPNCDATLMTNDNCTTATFVNTHFAPCYPDVCMVTTFFFHYAAGDQGLVEHEWKNASPDRGGNSGDIASTDPDD